MLYNALNKIAMLTLLLAVPTSVFYFMMFTPLLLGSMPLVAGIANHLLFLVGVSTSGFLAALLFQAASRNYSQPFVALLFLWYIFPAEWLGVYEIYSTLLWLFIFIILIFKTNTMKVSPRYWAFFMLVWGGLMHFSMYFTWTSNFAHNQGYEYWVSDEVHYHIPAQWATFFKETHEMLPASIKNTKVLIVGLSPSDSVIFGQSLGMKDIFLKIGGLAIPNPFFSLFMLNLKDFSEQSLLEYQEGEMLERMIIHEITHINQAQKYPIEFFFLPYWKKEAHATFVAKNFSLEGEYAAIQSIEIDSLPQIKNQIQMVLELDSDARFENYDFFQLQGWYYLDYLGMDLETFFSPSIEFANWIALKEAWLVTHQQWVNQQKSLLSFDSAETPYTS